MYKNKDHAEVFSFCDCLKYDLAWNDYDDDYDNTDDHDDDGG